jgi:cytochrome d ubiquinol oxidase subunit II
MTGLQVAWFVIVAVFVAAYSILDGFDLGVGILYALVGQDGEHREALHAAISPVWDGNEVWLILIGGLVFAVFPPVYASVFSGLYLVFMLALFGLILRSGALGLYYARVPTGRRWVLAFSGGSVVAGFFLGLIAGNLVRGVPLDAKGDFTGGMGSLFNPFAIVVAIFALAVFANQGAAWAAFKTVGEAHDLSRAVRRWTAWTVLALFAVVTILAVFLVSDHARALTGRGLGWVMIALVLGGIAAELGFGWRGHDRPAFLGASAAVVGLVGIWAVGVFPQLVPAANDRSLSLTVSSAAAPHASLVAMVVVAAIGVPLVAVCFSVVYRTFRGRLATSVESYGRGEEGRDEASSVQ